MKRILFAVLTLVALALAAPAHGTVPSTTSRADYTASGSTTAYAFTFRADADSWVQVLKGGVVQSTGYTVSRNADQSASPGGTVTFTVAPSAGTTVRIQRTTPQTQTLHFTPGGAFPAASHEAALDRLAMVEQDFARQLADVAAGLVGPSGPTGPTGPAGTPGAPGAPGANGSGAAVLIPAANTAATSSTVLISWTPSALAFVTLDCTIGVQGPANAAPRIGVEGNLLVGVAVLTHTRLGTIASDLLYIPGNMTSPTCTSGCATFNQVWSLKVLTQAASSGSTTQTLTLSSSTAGERVYVLGGHCTGL